MSPTFEGLSNVLLGLHPEAARIFLSEPLNGGLEFPAHVCVAAKCPLLAVQGVREQEAEEVPRGLKTPHGSERLKRNSIKVGDRPESGVLLGCNSEWRLL